MRKPSLFPRMIRGFTVVELLVAVAILLVILVVLLQVTGGVGEIWKSSTGKISAFQSARSAFATINRTLNRATLNTYNDYVDANGNNRTSANTGTFSPDRFLRASELHFLSGPTTALVPGATAEKNPGDAIFFQAPLGNTGSSNLAGLLRTVNSIGFYIQYGEPDDTVLPDWLKPLFAAKKRFRLVQVVEPTEDLLVYDSTAAAGYDRNWLQAFKLPPTNDQPRARVLAEDIVLLIFRPRLSPKDEESFAARLGVAFTDATRGSLLSPNYHYDSRSWETGYSGAVTGPDARKSLMRNQLPPIVDVAMVAVDQRSLARLDQTSDTPPLALQVPAGLFTDSSQLRQDLEAYSQKLTAAGIRHRIFNTSVEIQGAKWSNL